MTEDHELSDLSQTKKLWEEIGWATIVEPEHHNMDLLSGRFDRLLADGCPECHGVWTELVAIGFTVPRVGVASWNGFFVVSTKPDEPLGDRAARVRCFSGHTFDVDSFTGRNRKVEVSPWVMAGLLGMVVASAYAWGIR
jgi:hypothetical protein